MKILFITSATHLPYMRNMNHFQRVYFLSRQTELHILCRRGADFTPTATASTVIHRMGSDSPSGFLFAALLWMLRRGRQEGFDIVLTEPSIMALAGWLAKMVSDAKWVVDVWDIPIRGRSMTPLARFGRRMKRYLLKLAFRRADSFIMSMLPEFEFSYFGVPEEKMLILPNAIWVSDTGRHRRVPRDGNTPELLVMRSIFCADSGLDTVAEAYARLRAEQPDLRLTVLGRIPREVEPQIAHLAGDPAVTMVPFESILDHDAFLERLAAATACVIAYKPVADLSQIYPIKLLEYLTLGAVIVASDLPNFRRIINDGENGLLFDPLRAESLVEKIRLVLDDPDLAQRLSDRARETAGRFDCAPKNARIIEHLQQVAAGRRGAYAVS